MTVVGRRGSASRGWWRSCVATSRSCPELVTWRRGRSLSYGEGVAFWALGEMVKAQAGILESDAADGRRQKLAEAVAAVIADERDASGWRGTCGPLVGLDGEHVPAEDGRVEAFAAWRRFFEALAEEAADGARVRGHPLGGRRAARLHRPAGGPRRRRAAPDRLHCAAGAARAAPGLGRWQDERDHHLAAAALGEDTARLVGGLLDQALLPAEVQRTLLERAEETRCTRRSTCACCRTEVCSSQGERGLDARGRHRGLPESIQGIIAARLDTLTPMRRR